MKIFRQTYDKDLMKIYDEDVVKECCKIYGDVDGETFSW